MKDWGKLLIISIPIIIAVYIDSVPGIHPMAGLLIGGFLFGSALLLIWNLNGD